MAKKKTKKKKLKLSTKIRDNIADQYPDIDLLFMDPQTIIKLLLVLQKVSEPTIL